jgi:hypothetical protein
MMKQIHWLALGTLLFGAAVGCGPRDTVVVRDEIVVETPTEPPVKPERTEELIGQAAPELRPASWIQGNETTLAELRGSVVLLDFWAHW